MTGPAVAPLPARGAGAATPGSDVHDEPSYRFPRSHRLTRGGELQLVRREGKRIRTEHLEVRALASLLSHPRVGFIVPRYKHSAVDRNRLKRRLREIVRTGLLPRLATVPAPPVDVVVRALPHAYDASFETLRDQLARTVTKIGAGAPRRPPPDPGTVER
jgi:ribonuclease P protein component